MRQLITPRVIALLVGLFFALAALWGFVSGVGAVIGQGFLKEPTAEHEFHEHPNDYDFSFNGPFGKWDQKQLQRGLKVYDEVCSACHSLKFVAFRDLAALGLTEGQIKAYSAKKVVPGIDPVTGEPTTRPGTPTDYFPSPYPNAVAAAAANNNAIPPDLSLITKARHDGTNYVASLLTGYQAQPAKLVEEFPGAKTPPGLHYNPYFANLNLAMAPPLTTEGQVTFDDGTKSTIPQMAQDVAAFLTWTAEPQLVKRRQTGWAVMVFLLFATVLAYLSKQTVWAAAKPKKKV
ncbi:cytochrome c1 [Qipengyuania sp.]|uniref:cytochrome c1 n=1 Tax=Qipengyuania sp. TaxID=2004515 RepID=UPI0035C79036